MMKRHLFLLAFVALAPLANAACTTYEKAKPKIPVVELGQSAQSGSTANYQPVELSQWWKSFNDPTLNKLVDEAISQNYDIALAAHRITEARAQNQYSRAQNRPAAAVGAKVTGEELSENGLLPINKLGGIIDRDQLIFQYGLDASWEIDVFGGLKHQIDASDAAVTALIYSKEATKIAVIAEITRLYFDLNNTTRELEATKAYLNNLNTTIALMQNHVKRGNLAPKDLDETIARRDAYASQLPSLEAKRRDLAYGIATILGKPPESTRYLLDIAPKEPQIFAVPVGERSELLQRRPDIHVANELLKMHASEIMATKAEYYPKFKISAQAGWETNNFSKAIDESSVAAAIVPGIEWNIFSNGRIKAQVNAAEAREQQAMDEYSQKVINALNDSERALNDYKAATDTIIAQNAAIKSQSSFYQHQLQRYKAGDISRIDVLDAQRDLQNLKIQNIKAQSAAQTQMVTLFKALGGGWDSQLPLD